MVVATATALAQFLRFGRITAPLTMLTGRPRVYLATSAWILLGPLLSAAVCGAVTLVFLSTPLTGPGEGAELSWIVLGVTVASVGVLTTAVWLVGTRLAVRGMARWRPGGPA